MRQQNAQRLNQDKSEQAKQDADNTGENDHIANGLRRLFRLLPPQTQAVDRRKTVAKKGGQGNRDRGDGSDDVRSAVSQITDAMPDKNLVNDVVQGIDDQGNDARYRIFPQQGADLFGAERVFVICFMLHNKPPFRNVATGRRETAECDFSSAITNPPCFMIRFLTNCVKKRDAKAGWAICFNRILTIRA